jgi:rsbT co-antagonist protein RsbR
MITDSAVHSSATSVAQLLERFEITEDDLVRIREYGNVIAPKSDQFVDEFYGWLRLQPEFEQFFPGEAKLAEVQALTEVYWRQFFAATIDDDYIKSRRKVGVVHARIGLPLPSYLAAVNRSVKVITESLYDGGLDDQQYAAAVKSIAKLIYLDVTIIVDAFNTHTNQIITDQAEAMLSMSTPVTEIWDSILLLPIVGIIDSKRAQEIMTAVLSKISETHATTMILDISGVAIVDTAVANHLIKVTKATQLMGCRSVISGLSPAIAQTMVELGINVGDIRTTSTLKDALAFSFKSSGIDLEHLGR